MGVWSGKHWRDLVSDQPCSQASDTTSCERSALRGISLRWSQGGGSEEPEDAASLPSGDADGGARLNYFTLAVKRSDFRLPTGPSQRLFAGKGGGGEEEEEGEGCVNLMCPGTKAIGGGGGRGWGGVGGAEKMLVLVVVITAVGEQRAHVGPCVSSQGVSGGAANLRRHSPSPRIKPTHKRLNLHDGICKAAKSSVSPD